jgi:hypothetical protein
VSDLSRGELEAEILAWMSQPSWAPDEKRFERLALGLFRFQARECAPYRALLARRGVDPAQVSTWLEIPAVPTGAFKELEIRSFPETDVVRVFRTSGTSTARRGCLYLDTLELYDASLRPSFRRALLPDLEPGRRIAIRVLAPSPGESPDSSLSHMFGAALDEWGDTQSGFDFANGTLQTEALKHSLEACRGPVLLCGTAFGFVHWLEELERTDTKLSLPDGSRMMETGGFKGRSRNVPRLELYAAFEERLGVPPQRIVNQYGMTELGSQFYDSVLCQPGPRRKIEPPWARVRIVNPDTGRDAAPGEVGIIEIVDLANTGSVLALQTSDLGRRVTHAGVASGFEVLGRAEGAEQRGCSVAVDAMLG